MSAAGWGQRYSAECLLKMEGKHDHIIRVCFHRVSPPMETTSFGDPLLWHTGRDAVYLTSKQIKGTWQTQWNQMIPLVSAHYCLCMYFHRGDCTEHMDPLSTIIVTQACCSFYFELDDTADSPSVAVHSAVCMTERGLERERAPCEGLLQPDAAMMNRPFVYSEAACTWWRGAASLWSAPDP